MVQTELRRTALAVRMWRRNHPAEPMTGMPVDLQQNIVRLLEGHSWDEVCEAVGIGKSSLSILRRRHCEDLKLRRRVAPRKRKLRRTARSGSVRKEGTVRLARVVPLPTSTNPKRGVEPLATDEGRLVVELGGVRVGVRDGFTPSTLGAVLDVLEARGRKEA